MPGGLVDVRARRGNRQRRQSGPQLSLGRRALKLLSQGFGRTLPGSFEGHMPARANASPFSVMRCKYERLVAIVCVVLVYH